MAEASVGVCIAGGHADQGGGFSHAKGTADRTAGRLREIAEKFSAVIVEAGAAADDKIAVRGLGRPGETEARRDAPLASVESGG